MPNQLLNSILKFAYENMENNKICLLWKGINDTNLNDVINFLNQCLDVRKICLYGNEITDKGVLLLAENKNIKELCLVFNDNITSSILNSFNKNTNFKKIYIDNKHCNHLKNDNNLFIFCENTLEQRDKTVVSVHCQDYQSSN